MNKLFNSKYPILCANMFGGSDLKLALAVNDAGAFPSYMVPQDTSGHVNLDALYDDICEFKSYTGHTNILIGGIGQSRLKNIKLLNVLKELKIGYIELFDDNACEDLDQSWNNPQVLAGIKFLKRQAKVFARIYKIKNYATFNYFDGLCIKGKESAGRSGHHSVDYLFKQQKIITPSISLIPYGGVGTPRQVQDYIARGAETVAVGTLFAACVESSLSEDVKFKMIGLTSKNIVNIPNTKQNSIIFNDTDPKDLPIDPNDWNRCTLLNQGLRGDGTQGLIYVGSAIDYVTKIRTVKETVEYLVQDLK